MLVKKAYLNPVVKVTSINEVDVVTASVLAVGYNAQKWGESWDGWNVKEDQ